VNSVPGQGSSFWVRLPTALAEQFHAERAAA
jgi:signal transduction histidine kinase